MTLWFVSAAVLTDLVAETGLSDRRAVYLSSSVSAGFVLGALGIAITGLADRVDPRRLFALCAILAALGNASLMVVPADSALAILGRLVVGLCLAGVYPVGMKIAVGWGTSDRGWLVGLLVGGLTLGTAMPHGLAWLGGGDWRTTTLVASALAALGGLLVLLTQLGPHHAVSPRFDASAVVLAWRDRVVRRAFLGYLGHMWELYAMWAWISVALLASYQLQMPSADAESLARLTAFVAIGSGALLCPMAGRMADRIGKARLTILVMSISAASAVASAAAFGGPVWLMFLATLLWGASVIPDSAQFSALVADAAPPEKAGSLMTLQTSLGFALTVFTVQAVPAVAGLVGWPATFLILALGPVAGIIAMWPLARQEQGFKTGSD